MEDKTQQLADHVRTVHFALLLTSMVLILGAVQPVESDVMRAHEDARSISRFFAQQEEIEKQIEQRIAQPERKDYSERWGVTPIPRLSYFQSGSMQLQVKFVPYFEEPESVPCKGDVRCHGLGDVPITWKNRSGNPTITVFEVYWDMQIRHRGLGFVPDELGLTCKNSDLFRDGKHILTLTKAPAADAVGVKPITVDLGATSGEPGRASTGCLVDPIPTHQYSTPVRSVISNALGRRDWDSRFRFDQEFSALIRSTTENQRDYIPVDRLTKDLEAKSREAPPAIDMFGLKIPQRNLVAVGTAVLALCQFYFWAHLAQLHSFLVGLRAEQWPTGYLMLYPSAQARWIAGSTTFAVPALVIGGLLFLRPIGALDHGVQHSPYEVTIVGIALTIAIYLGYRIFHLLTNLQAAEKAPILQPAKETRQTARKGEPAPSVESKRSNRV